MGGRARCSDVAATTATSFWITFKAILFASVLANSTISDARSCRLIRRLAAYMSTNAWIPSLSHCRKHQWNKLFPLKRYFIWPWAVFGFHVLGANGRRGIKCPVRRRLRWSGSRRGGLLPEAWLKGLTPDKFLYMPSGEFSGILALITCRRNWSYMSILLRKYSQTHPILWCRRHELRSSRHLQ